MLPVDETRFSTILTGSKHPKDLRDVHKQNQFEGYHMEMGRQIRGSRGSEQLHQRSFKHRNYNAMSSSSIFLKGK
jgi:hypothetical protein